MFGVILCLYRGKGYLFFHSVIHMFWFLMSIWVLWY